VICARPPAPQSGQANRCSPALRRGKNSVDTPPFQQRLHPNTHDTDIRTSLRNQVNQTRHATESMFDNTFAVLRRLNDTSHPPFQSFRPATTRTVSQSLWLTVLLDKSNPRCGHGHTPATTGMQAPTHSHRRIGDPKVFVISIIFSDSSARLRWHFGECGKILAIL
jgi:hypothetical protein